MLTSKAIPVICQVSAFNHSKLQALSSAPNSVMGTSKLILSSTLKRKSGCGKISMSCKVGASIQDPHSTLGVAPGASKREIKKAYRHLALQFHPDVCKGNHCTTNFQHINSAYETLLSKPTMPQAEEVEDDFSSNLEGFMGVGNENWEEWEEWMGWDGAGVVDYYESQTNNVPL